MNRFQATSRCECEALLNAILDDQHHVLEGWASHRGGRENAPAHSINAALPHFDVGWLCPFCGRNTLRTFYAGALRALPAPPTLPGLPAPYHPLSTMGAPLGAAPSSAPKPPSGPGATATTAAKS
jgi:hypothetical protein